MEFIKDFENNIIKLGFPYLKINDLPSFPYQEFAELKADEENKKISINTKFDKNAIDLLSNKFEKSILNISLIIPWLISFALFIASLIYFQFYYFSLILVLVIGCFLSSPGGKGCGNWLSVCLLILFFSYKKQVIVDSSYCFFIGYICCCFGRLWSHGIIQERVLMSESIFCYLYYNQTIAIRDNSSNKIFMYQGPFY